MSNFNENNDDEYAINFTISRKPNQDASDFSNIISETYLKEDCILLKKKSLIKRKSISIEKIFYLEILELNLNKSSYSSLSSSVDIIYTKNGYSKRFISLSTADIFAVRWFYDALIEKYNQFKFNSTQNSPNSDNDDDLDFNKEKNKEESNKIADFMDKMSEPISKEDARKIKISKKFDRCSSGNFD